MTIQVTTNDRKKLVKAISEHLQREAEYMGPPTFAYIIGPVMVARDGEVSADDPAVMDALKTALIEKGFLSAVPAFDSSEPGAGCADEPEAEPVTGPDTIAHRKRTPAEMTDRKRTPKEPTSRKP